MNLEDRVKRLEDLYDPMYHKIDMLEIHIEKLVNFLPKHLSATTKFAYSIEGHIRQLRDFLRIVDGDMQTHYEGHYQKEKPKKTNRYNKYIP